MKFAVQAWSNGRARAGVVQLGSCPYPIETPALLLTTRKALPVFMSPDLIPSLPSPDSHLLQFSPLHLFHYSPDFNADYEIKMGLYDTIQRMCPSPILREKVDRQIDIFHNAEKMFGMDMAIQMRNKKQPALWWDSFGGGTPELQQLAIRILSLTCSATGCERNWSTFDQVHSKRRNRLEQQILSALVFVKYNLRLEARHQKRILEGDSYDPICLSDLESDDEWITEKEDAALPEDTTWMNANECFDVQEGESSKKRKRGPRDLNKKKGKEVVELEDENDDEGGDDDVQEVGEDIGSDDFLELLSPKAISDIGGLHQLLGLHEYGFAAIPRDSILCFPECDSTNKTGASFETPCGRRLIRPVEYMEMISSMKPNLWATLADEVPAWVSEKRNKTSVDRTVRWLDDCIMLSPTGGAVFGSIVGGFSVEERVRCAKEVVRRNVSGYWVGGFGLGERIDERSALLTAVTDILPEEKPRQISGLGLPEEVLQGVAAGIDLFDSTYIYHLTLGGFALTFPLDRIERDVSDYQLCDIGSDHTKINLKAPIFRKDTSPIVDSCNCYTCRNHTKAYINHLLNVHEMLAQILLEIHNTHHYLAFFRSIREAIKEGKFEQFRQKFVETRRDNLFGTSLRV